MRFIVSKPDVERFVFCKVEEEIGEVDLENTYVSLDCASSRLPFNHLARRLRQTWKRAKSMHFNMNTFVTLLQLEKCYCSRLNAI